MTESKPIRFHAKGVAVQDVATDALAEPLHGAYARFAAAIDPAAGSARHQSAISILSEFANLADAMDQQYGPDAPLPIADLDEVTIAGLTASAELEGWVSQSAGAEALADLDRLTLGMSLWAMRHGIELNVAEPVVNALARRSNSATSKQEAAAAFAMTQGVIESLRPTFGSDLERSNPERPWRLLNVNFAICAIRTADPALMRFAFDQLNVALPDECAGFYTEALTIADQAGLPRDIRDFIADECRRWAAVH